MPNRLADSTSPYLLQHKDNPVDWYEWGPEAFAAATERDVPVLLSVGYSTCHWCHVMAHESFEDDTTAAYMNDHFVNVKVDREERPDVDRIYMDAVTAMTGRGGWPMTVFLTPAQQPIHAGTYYPKEPMHSHPSFMDVMRAVSNAWTTNRTGAEHQAQTIVDAINRSGPPPGPEPTHADLESAVAAIFRTFDQTHGGFGGAPKFPQAPTLEFLLRMAALFPDTETAMASLQMLTSTLENMARGGIYDHLMGGFARYSVDANWTIPHFEKMLYDNALLARIYLRTWQLTGDERFLTTATEVLDYLDREMADPAGGIHSGEDADSEGQEGKFAVWEWDELESILGDDLAVAADMYGFTEEGNFEGANNPVRRSSLTDVAEQHGLTGDALDATRVRIDDKLRTVRAGRVQPSRDDKLVTAWNALALRAFAEAAAVLDHDRYLERAVKIGRFLSETAQPDGRLVRSWRGEPGVPGYADDHAAAAIGLYTLYSVTGDSIWFTAAERLIGELMDRFAAPDGGFFATASDAEDLISRPKNIQDNPTPSDNALAMEALLMHAAFTGDLDAINELARTMRSISVVATRHPSFAGHALAVWATHLAGVHEVAITGPDTRPLERVVWDTFRPETILAVATDASSEVPLLRDRFDPDATRAFVCHNLTCDLPVSSPEALKAHLAEPR